jgi:ribulose-5-phosphate 4-epimerase/fuculose-1-phosphate aldolase
MAEVKPRAGKKQNRKGSASRVKNRPAVKPSEKANKKGESAGVLQQIARRLDSKGAFGEATGSVSIRIPGGDEFQYMESKTRSRNGVRKEKLNYEQESVNDLHSRIYHRRPDVGAIMIGHPTWAMALGELGLSMPGVFDEQARQLGRSIRSVPESSGDSDQDGIFKELSDGSNVVILSDSVLVCGVTAEKLVFNAELLEKCARAYLLAHLTGKKIRKVPFYVRIIAHKRMLKDAKRSAESYARGEIPGGFTAY